MSLLKSLIRSERFSDFLLDGSVCANAGILGS